MKNDRSAFCIFCDDIRIEVGNKFSLIGTYAGQMEIFAPQFPVMLPKLGIHIWVVSPIDDLPKSISGSVIGPSGDEIASLKSELLPNRDAESPESKKISVNMMAIISPVPIPSEGYLEVWLDVDGEKERAGRLKVTRSDSSSNASLVTFPMPPQQSPPSSHGQL